MAPAIVGDSPSARIKGVRHGWRVLGILSALMGFASISTDLSFEGGEGLRISR